MPHHSTKTSFKKGTEHPLYGTKFSIERRKNISEALKGRKRPPFSKEWRERMSKNRKGKKFGEEHRKRISEGLKGIKRPPITMQQRINKSLGATKEKIFTGFKSRERTRLMASKEYKLWRKSVFERDNYACVWCGVRNGNGKAVILNADHIKPFALYPELRFAIDNGRTLCKECHLTTDTYGNRKIK